MVSTPLKNISQLGLFPIYGKLKHVPNHQPLISRAFSAIFDETTGYGEQKNPGASLQFAAATASRQSKGQPWDAQPQKSDEVLYPDGDDSYTIKVTISDD